SRPEAAHIAAIWRPRNPAPITVTTEMVSAGDEAFGMVVILQRQGLLRFAIEFPARYQIRPACGAFRCVFSVTKCSIVPGILATRHDHRLDIRTRSADGERSETHPHERPERGSGLGDWQARQVPWRGGAAGRSR